MSVPWSFSATVVDRRWILTGLVTLGSSSWRAVGPVPSPPAPLESVEVHRFLRNLQRRIHARILLANLAAEPVVAQTSVNAIIPSVSEISDDLASAVCDVRLQLPDVRREWSWGPHLGRPLPPDAP